MQRVWYPALDTLKFVIAFSVLAMHTSVLNAFPGIWHQVGEALLYPAVSIFFMISGFLCFDKADVSQVSLRESGEAVSKMESRLLRSATTAFVMYVAWTAIYLPLNIILAYKDGTLGFGYLLEGIRIFVFSGMWNSAPQLWYLLALGLGYLALYWCVCHHINLLWPFGVSMVFTLTGYFVPWIAQHNAIFGMIYRVTFNDTRNVVFAGLFYITCGALIAVHKKAINAIPSVAVVAVLLVALAGSILVTSSGNMPFGMVFRVCIVVLAIRPTGTPHPTLRAWGAIIFLIHFYVVRVVQFVLANTGYNIPIDRNVTCFVLVSIISVIMAAILLPMAKRNSILRTLFHA